MLHGTSSIPQIQHGFQGLREIVFGNSDCVIQVKSLCQIGGDGAVRPDSLGNASTVMAKTGLEANVAGSISVSSSVVESGLVYAGRMCPVFQGEF